MGEPQLQIVSIPGFRSAQTVPLLRQFPLWRWTTGRQAACIQDPTNLAGRGDMTTWTVCRRATPARTCNDTVRRATTAHLHTTLLLADAFPTALLPALLYRLDAGSGRCTAFTVDANTGADYGLRA